jgi:putative spermidine/putrescine transport system ATP-binding protein
VNRESCPTLELRKLSKRYEDTTAVRDVSLVVPGGQFLTLLGPSGSGKTTILNLIAGFIEPSGGEILLRERTISHLPPEKRDFGMVFQGYALFPHLSVFENVAFPLKLRKCRKPELTKLVHRALELVRLMHLANRMPRQLSGGQQQRVALARALVFSPHILLLDEPLSALDRKMRSELQWELKQLHQQVGMTFIYVTHDQEEAMSLSDEIAIIRDGVIVQKGRPRSLYEEPLSLFVADFLGESNFIRGQVISVDSLGFEYLAGERQYRQRDDTGMQRAGNDVVLALRPERICIGTNPVTGPRNLIRGEIETWAYQGQDYQFKIRTLGLGDMVVSTPAWSCKVEPIAGGSVWLSWNDDASVAVIDDGSGFAASTTERKPAQVPNAS